MTRISFRCRAGLIALAGSLAPIVGTPAQQPMVFVHGAQNDGSAWASTANFLQSRFAIQPIRPTTGWSDYIVQQEQRLYDAISPYSGIPALAHSIGGLVSRQHIQARGSGSSIDRLATIGTAHGALPFATNALNGNVGAWAQEINYAIGDPIYFYSNWDPDWWWAEPIGLESAAGNMRRFGDFVPFAVLNGLGVGAIYPVNYDLRPGNGFLADLNSSGALSVEASVLRSRVGIGTATRPQDAFMRLMLSNWREWTTTRWTLHRMALMLYAYYADHWDYYLRANAWRWDRLALYMMDFDVVWQWQIGALRYAVCTAGWCYGEVYASDGLVPLSRQTYPGATRQQTVGGDIVHTQQKNSATTRDAFVNVLRYDFGVPENPPPQQSSLTATIIGPTNVRTNATCSWQANVSGGSPPYSYYWSKPGYSSTDSEAMTSFSGSGTLYLQVSDAAGHIYQTSKSISASSSNPMCRY
jgi:hypothetical protein